MGFLFIFAAVLMIIGLFYLFLAFRSRNPENLGVAVGILTKSKSFKNVKTRYSLLKNVTDYTYNYTVNGKDYHLTGSVTKHRRTVLQKVTIVYMKGLPRFAYIDEYTAVIEWSIGVSFPVLSCILLFLCICALI